MPLASPSSSSSSSTSLHEWGQERPHCQLMWLAQSQYKLSNVVHPSAFNCIPCVIRCFIKLDTFAPLCFCCLQYLRLTAGVQRRQRRFDSFTVNETPKSALRLDPVGIECVRISTILLLDWPVSNKESLKQHDRIWKCNTSTNEEPVRLHHTATCPNALWTLTGGFKAPLRSCVWA